MTTLSLIKQDIAYTVSEGKIKADFQFIFNQTVSWNVSSSNWLPEVGYFFNSLTDSLTGRPNIFFSGKNQNGLVVSGNKVSYSYELGPLSNFISEHVGGTYIFWIQPYYALLPVGSVDASIRFDIAPTYGSVVQFDTYVNEPLVKVLYEAGYAEKYSVTDTALNLSRSLRDLSLNLNLIESINVSDGYPLPVSRFQLISCAEVLDLIQEAGGSFYIDETSVIGDTFSPQVLEFSPLDASEEVSVGSNITFVFDEVIQAGTGYIQIRSGSPYGALVASYNVETVNANLNFSDTTLTINPSINLSNSSHYFVVLPAGAVKDIAGNSYAGTSVYDFTTSTTNPVTGDCGNNTLTPGVGNDAIDGGAGIDTAVYTLGRSDYDISVSGAGFNINALTGSEGFDSLVNVEKLVFSDMTVDLTMAAQAALLTPLQLQTLEELYVGFFNRVPEANGLSYWISQIHGGATLREVADQFYSAGVQFGVFDANMTEAQFITKVYENVLGRTGVSAPDNSEIGYWQTWLHTGTNSKGAMVLQMLNDSHNFFTGDPVVGWVIDLLDNKAAVANYFGIEQGISYNTPEENIDRGIAIAALITPTDISEAITLIGITDQIV